jgi:hypothetical protein
VLTLILATTAFRAVRADRLDELSMERLNIVEPDGRVRMVLANRARTPGPIEHGQTVGYPAGQRSGIVFLRYHPGPDRHGRPPGRSRALARGRRPGPPLAGTPI